MAIQGALVRHDLSLAPDLPLGGISLFAKPQI
jgi:hypothetical protein